MDLYGKKIIAVTGTGTFLSVVNSSSLLIAIPTIMVELRTSFFLAIWVIVAYSLALTVLTPILGKYSDIVGRKKIYSFGYLVFFAGSVMSAASFEGTLLLAGRLVQGVGGAFLFSNSLAIITDTFSAVELREAMGINAAILALGTSIGPLIGGVLTEITWRAIFIFNMPIALAGFVLSQRVVKEIPGNVSGHIDSIGAILMSFTIILGIIFMTVLPGLSVQSPLFIALLAGTIVFFALFLYQEGQSKRPIINPEILKNRMMSISIIALVIGSLTRFSVLLVMTLLFQGPFRFSPIYTGIVLIPIAGSMGVMSYLSGAIKQKVSDIALEVMGLSLTGIGALLLAVFILFANSYLYLAGAMILVGAGSGLFYTPNSTIIMLSAKPNVRGEAAGIRTLMVNLGSVFGLTMVFLMISAYVPSTIVTSIFLGIAGPSIQQYVSLFDLATVLVLAVSGILSLIPVLPIIHAARKQ